jgi:C4-dicarboxylate-specific signal transduction histidine kinase
MLRLVDASHGVQPPGIEAEIAHAARISVLGELAASIAHEVSQPLTAIENNNEASLLWLAHSPPNIEAVRELAARTAVEVQRAANVLHRIRLMVLRTNPEQERESIAINATIEEAVLFLRHELQSNRIETSLQLAPGLPSVLGDRVQLQQVIINLAVNAIQAMAAVGGTARQLAIRTDAASEGDIVIHVEDTGPGIAHDVIGRLFESFFSTRAASLGMGMGLAICRSIIEAHGGRIAAANRQDRAGARFSMLLPTTDGRNRPAAREG